MSTPSRYFGTAIPLALISTFLIGFVSLTMYTHAASFGGRVGETLREGSLMLLGLTAISVLTLRIMRKKTVLRTLFSTVIEGAKGAVLFVGGDQFFVITNSTTLDWTQITTIIPIFTIISLYLPRQRLEAITGRKWGQRVTTAMPAILFILLMLSGYIVELGKTRHQGPEEPGIDDIDAQYFEAGFKGSFWKGIQLEAPEDVVFVVDPAPISDFQRLWRIQVWDRYTTRDWQQSLRETVDPDEWEDPIPSEQDEIVELVDDPITYEITIPIDHGEGSARMYLDYLPTGWWDAETYGTYINPYSFDVVSDISYEDPIYSVETGYSTYRGEINFHDVGLSNLTYEIEYYPFNFLWPTMTSVLRPEDIDEQEWKDILPRFDTYEQLPSVGGSPYPDPSEHPWTYGNATALNEAANADDLNIYQRALRINDFLANNYEFDNESFYGTELAEENVEGVDMVEWFLGRGKGTHVHFASAMAVFLRYQKIPCRVVRGYAEGTDVRGVTLVKQMHIMVWVEVFLPYELRGTLKGRWHPFFPILALGTSPRNYQLFVWPGNRPPPIGRLWAQEFAARTNQPFQLNAFVLNNETQPPLPVPAAPVTFLDLNTLEIIGEGITNETGIATIETMFTVEDPHGPHQLGAKLRDGIPFPSIPPPIHRKYEIYWFETTPPVIVQGRTYPLTVQLIRSVDTTGLGPGINVTFGDNLYLRRAGGEEVILHETPIKYWAFTNGESIAHVEFMIPTEVVDFPLGNHTVLASFTYDDDYIAGYSDPYFVTGAVVINPSLAASVTRTQVLNIIPLPQESPERQVGVSMLLKMDFFRKHAMLCPSTSV